MINFSDVAIRRGVKLLFEKANFTINRGEKVGLVGANGCGKSSLFALLLNRLQSDEGEVYQPPDLTIAHVAQETPAIERSAVEYVIDGDIELREIQSQLNLAESQNNGSLQAELHHKLEDIGAYSVHSRAAKLLHGLGFKEKQLQMPVSSFSGGWRMRLNLAQALICRSDLLLLDEPTNHLDLDAVIWLESWLITYQGTLLLISHDRDFLDKVTDRILHIEQQRINSYSGNYSHFEKLRAEQLAQQRSLYEKQQKEIAHIQSFVRRFKAKASKAKQAQSRIKTLERMELISQAHVDSPFYFNFYKPEKLPHPLIKLEEIDAGYNEHKILEKINQSILPGDRIGILGHNGAGKSTLVKLLAGELLPMTGDVVKSSELNIGYFAQHQLEQLDETASPLLHFQRLKKDLKEQEIRDYLGGFNFHGDRVLEKVGSFSGGEKARLVLAMIILNKPNLLLLDEPTNHLDMEMRHALSLALQDYEGAMLIVSHDRHLLRMVTDRFLLVDKGKAELFDGDLDDYRLWLMKPGDENKTGVQVEIDNTSLSRKEIRQFQAEKRRLLQPLQSKIRKIEQNIEELTLIKGEIEAKLADSGIYKDDNKKELQSCIKRRSEVTENLARLEEEWLVISEELEKEAK